MGQRLDIEELGNREPVSIEGWPQPMIPITAVERAAMIAACEARMRREHLQSLMAGMAPEETYGAFQQPLRIAIEIIESVGGLDVAVYNVLRLLRSHIVARKGPNDWCARELMRLQKKLEARRPRVDPSEASELSPEPKP